MALFCSFVRSIFWTAVFPLSDVQLEKRLSVCRLLLLWATLLSLVSHCDNPKDTGVLVTKTLSVFVSCRELPVFC